MKTVSIHENLFSRNRIVCFDRQGVLETLKQTNMVQVLLSVSDSFYPFSLTPWVCRNCHFRSNCMSIQTERNLHNRDDASIIYFDTNRQLFARAGHIHYVNCNLIHGIFNLTMFNISKSFREKSFNFRLFS